jgi:hypothetical protein
MHFRAILRQEGLDPGDAPVPDARINPNGTGEVLRANVPLEFTPMGL